MKAHLLRIKHALRGVFDRKAPDPICDRDPQVGEVTSGAFSPCLKKNVAMGYVKKAYGKAGTQLKVAVRGRTATRRSPRCPLCPTPTSRRPPLPPERRCLVAGALCCEAWLVRFRAQPLLTGAHHCDLSGVVLCESAVV